MRTKPTLLYSTIAVNVLLVLLNLTGGMMTTPGEALADGSSTLPQFRCYEYQPLKSRYEYRYSYGIVEPPQIGVLGNVDE